MRKNFEFLEDFKLMADKLPDDMRLKFYDAITNYAFFGIESDDPIIGALVIAVKSSLDKIDGRTNNGGNHNPKGVNQHKIDQKEVNSGQSLVNSGQSLVNSGQSLVNSGQSCSNIFEKEKEKERHPLEPPERINKNKIIYPPLGVPPIKKNVQNGCRFENSEFFSEDLPECFSEEASKLGVDVTQASEEYAKFRDYWIAKTGADATKRDWVATWRNWVRRAYGGQVATRSRLCVPPTREEMEAFLGRKMEFECEVANEFAV